MPTVFIVHRASQPALLPRGLGDGLPGASASGPFYTAGVRHFARSLSSLASSSASAAIARTQRFKQARSAARAQVNVSSFVMSKIFGRTRLSTPLNEVAEA